jgi:hypothetical protein
MPSFGCRCGRGIPLIQIPLDNGGHILRDTDHTAREMAVQSITAYIMALLQGERERFVKPLEGWLSPEASDAEVIQYLLSDALWKASLETFQCYFCGRIWIEDSLNPGHFNSYRPDGKWRGTFAVHPSGFLGYAEETAFFQYRFEGIERQGDNAIVTFSHGDNEQITVRFLDVVSIEKKVNHDWIHPTGEGLRVMALGQWEAEPPYHRYVFEDYYFNNEPGYLAIVARRYEIVDVG